MLIIIVASLETIFFLVRKLVEESLIISFLWIIIASHLPYSSF